MSNRRMKYEDGRYYATSTLMVQKEIDTPERRITRRLLDKIDDKLWSISKNFRTKQTDF